ncbi:MAG TPA: class I SAM-dependent methyltransferase [Gammaproteobacteria bacterium]|nr:class I SAM-dependent methyltransferase [Gammaproteobacteria bacterium]
MLLDKTLLRDEQYKDAKGYRSRLALLDYAVEKYNLWEWTAGHYDFSQVKTVLEVGCGTGDFWNSLQANPQAFDEILLTDFSEGMLNTARETLAHSPFHEKIKFEVADVEALSYPDKKFDVVLAHLMLYHPKSPKQALSEISRVLKKEGWVGITTFNLPVQQREIWVLANKIDTRFPDYAVTIETFDEKIADKLLPEYFARILKYNDEVVVKVPKSEILVDLMRHHPVSQMLELKEDFFTAFQIEAEKIITRDGFFKTVFTPTLYICKGNAHEAHKGAIKL